MLKARVRLRRIVALIDEHEGSPTPEVYARVTSLTFTALNSIRRLVESLDGTGPDIWNVVLDQLSIW